MSQMPAPRLWIQRNHLQMASREPFMGRLAPTRLHPDFQPLYTQEDLEQIRQDCLDIANEFELDVNRSGLVSRLEHYLGILPREQKE